jgi:hypothetical protein
MVIAALRPANDVGAVNTGFGRDGTWAVASDIMKPFDELLGRPTISGYWPVPAAS